MRRDHGRVPGERGVRVIVVRFRRDLRLHDNPALAGRGSGSERPAEQIEGFASFAQAALRQPLLVHRVAADQVFAQGVGGPLLKADTSLGVDAITDGDDGIKVVMFEITPYSTVSFDLNYREILGSCLFLQFTVLEDVLHVESDVVR